MAYEIGGRADKYGNRFEYNWTISRLLDVLNEKISYVIIEAIGDDKKDDGEKIIYFVLQMM